MRIVTRSGAIVSLLGNDWTPDINDIAFSLSQQVRYTGHVDGYSVAQHSVLVSHLVPQQYAFAGLMHDAHEAYSSDIASPVKQLFRSFNTHEVDAFEYRIAVRVRKYFGLPTNFPDEVKEADDRAARIEIAYLFSSEAIESFISLGYMPEYGEPIEVWSSERARFEFLMRFREISCHQ